MKKYFLLFILFCSCAKLIAQENISVSTVAVMKFDSTEYHFGKINPGEIIVHEFQFTNVGKEPLLISTVRGGYHGCVPNYSKEPIKPGQKGIVRISLSTSGQSGKLDKVATVESNNRDGIISLHLIGEIIPNTADAAIMTFDSTMLKCGTVFQGTIVRKDFYFTNTGKSSLLIYTVYASDDGGSVSYSKEPIEPGKSGIICNAQPWDNLKFNLDGITEVQRKFFGTLYNTYSFFALYANIDGFIYKEDEIPVNERPEIDRWILSELNSLIKFVDECYDDYEPTKACRAIQDFVTEHLSNWYVRLCRRRFWKGEYTQDKIAAYQTLYTCLEAVAQLMSPVAPFYADRLFTDLNNITHRQKNSSVHLSDFPKSNESLIDKLLEERMELGQKISSMVLSLRKKVNIRVRQPLNKILLPVLDSTFQSKVESVKGLILAEVNVKEIHYITDTAGILVKKIKPNFKVLGKKVGGLMKDVAAAIGTFTQPDILKLEGEGKFELKVKDQTLTLEPEDVEILSEDIPGWQVASEGRLTVALDIKIDEKLKEEGIAREFINRIQNIRKDKGFEVTDKIDLKVQNHTSIKASILNNKEYICAEILATSLDFTDNIAAEDAVPVEVDDDTITLIKIKKHE